MSVWIRVLNDNVYSDKIASRYLSSRSMLVFGMYMHVTNSNISTARRYDFGSISTQYFSHGPSSRRKPIANIGILIDRISSIPQLVRLVRHYESYRTADQSWRCRWHFRFRGRAGRTGSMSSLGSGIRSTWSSNGK